MDECKVFADQVAEKVGSQLNIPVYLYELASEFHSYWNMGRADVTKRFIEKDNTIKDEKIVFLKVVSNIIKSGMNIIGVDTPEKM